MPSSHLILCHPLLLLPPIPPSIRGFSNESTLCMRWPKYWNFSLSIIPSKEIPGLISFRMDWLHLLAVQGTMSRSQCSPPEAKGISGLHSRRTRGDRHPSRVEAKNPALLSSHDGYLLELTGWTKGSQAS